jgi:uncharacterized protein (DUF488 family)
MVKNGSLLENENYFIKNNQDDFVKSLKVEDKKIITEVVQLYGNMNSNSLIKHTYINFPYYAINSTIADKVLDEKQLEKVISSKKEGNETILFTIGYEGVSLEKYLNKLVSNDVKLLIDVRKNSLSMKFGFSKSLLKKYCESLDIEVYKKTTLKETDSYQTKIIELLSKYKRIALTCFEADICQCHRKPLAEAIAKNPIFEYEVKHI